jgi:hypothetical protein
MPARWRTALHWLRCLLALSALGCKNPLAGSNSNLAVAQFGMFFGGQIQQRVELPFEFDSTRQTQGFRLLFERPLAKKTVVEWTLDYPTARTGPRGPSNAPRAQRSERAILPKGADRFEQLLTLRPTDVPGTFNIRVSVDDTVVLDRPFRLMPRQVDN